MEPFPNAKPKSSLRTLLCFLLVVFGATFIGFQWYTRLPEYLQITSLPVNKAIAVMSGYGTEAFGTVTFSQRSPQGYVTVVGRIQGLSSNQKHGFHVHEFGNLTDGCTSAGRHYNPFGKKHGDRLSAERHLGDLGNIVADGAGVATFTFADNVISLTGDNSIVGYVDQNGTNVWIVYTIGLITVSWSRRAVVVHADCDDGGQGGNPGSEENGNSGVRVACGVIGS